jgi:hypothetical protein
VSDALEPVTKFANDRTVQLWRQRTEPPLLDIRCARGKRPCRDRIGHAYETPDGTVVVFFQHSPDRPVALDLPDGLPEGYDPPATFKKFDAESKKALIRGHRDERGTAVTLEDDAHWSDITVSRHPTRSGSSSVAAGDGCASPRTRRSDTGRRRSARFHVVTSFV